MTLPRKLLLLLLAVLGLAAIAAAYLMFLFDWRGTASRYAGEATGRQAAIEGDMAIDWGRRTRITLNRIMLGNMESGSGERMFSAERVVVSVDVLALLRGDLVLPELVLQKPELLLEKDAQGKANWDFSANPAAAAVAATAPENRAEFPAIGRLRIEDGSLRYKNPAEAIDVTFLTSTTVGEAGENENLQLKGEGSYNRKPFRMTLRGASVVALRDADEPYPLRAELKIGDTEAWIEGSVVDPVQMEGLDLTMRLKGADMAELFPILGVALPPTPPYDVQGRLAFEQERRQWRFTHFKGRMGDSDLSGSAVWDVSGERPKLTASFTSNRLDFDDLGGFIGATPSVKPGETASQAQVRQAEAKEANPYVLPDAPLDITRLAAMDADVEFTGKRVISPNLPLDDFYLKAVLQDRELRLIPVKFGTADGEISATMTINARQKPVSIASEFTFRRLSLARLFENMKIGDKTANRGYIGGTASLKGTGVSLREMLGTSHGAIGLGMEGGELSNLLIELMGLDVAESLGFLLAGDKPVKIRCVIGDFAVENGLMRSRALVVDTLDTNVEGSGTLNLKDERMDITLAPHPKDVSVLALRAPIHVRGTLKKPEISIDAKALAGRGAVVVALSAILTPVAGFLGFLETGLGKDSDCMGLIQEMNAQQGKKGRAAQIPANP